MQFIERFFLVIIVFSLFSSCANKPKGNKVVTEDAKNVQGITVASDIFMVDVEKSIVNWIGRKPTGRHYGTVNIKEGKIGMNERSIVGGTVIIDMNSIIDLDIDDQEMNAKLVGHLKSPDFFDVEKYPEATFEITKIEGKEEDPIKLKMGEMLSNCVVTGNLAIKDSIKSIRFNALIRIKGGKLLAESNNFIIDRTDWGVNYGSNKIFDNLKDKFINDEITLNFRIVANK